MLMLAIFLGWLAVSPVVHYLLRQHPLASFHWLAPVVSAYARDRMFIAVFTGAIVLHFIGTRWLGQVAYNTTGFDVMTHTLFGFLTREMIERANEVHPFTAQIGERLPRSIGRRVTATTLALAFCLTHEAQECIQAVIPGLSGMVYVVGWPDQVKDLIMDTIGITISLKKEEGRLVTSAVSLVLMISLGVFLFSRR